MDFSGDLNDLIRLHWGVHRFQHDQDLGWKFASMLPENNLISACGS